MKKYKVTFMYYSDEITVDAEDETDAVKMAETQITDPLYDEYRVVEIEEN